MINQLELDSVHKMMNGNQNGNECLRTASGMLALGINSILFLARLAASFVTIISSSFGFCVVFTACTQTKFREASEEKSIECRHTGRRISDNQSRKYTYVRNQCLLLSFEKTFT